jgi:hypothetical protein
MKESKRGRRSDNKTGKSKGYKGIPKREVEDRNGRTVTRKLI